MQLAFGQPSCCSDLCHDCLEVLHLGGDVGCTLQVSKPKVGSSILHHLACQLQVISAYHHLHQQCFKPTLRLRRGLQTPIVVPHSITFLPPLHTGETESNLPMHLDSRELWSYVLMFSNTE